MGTYKEVTRWVAPKQNNAARCPDLLILRVMYRPSLPGLTAVSLLGAMWVAPAAAHAQANPTPPPATQASPPYVRRGREVETRQRQLTDRVTRFHDTLAVELRQTAPDLLPRLEPPPQIATGYQLLPKIVAGAAPQPVTAASPLVSYNWRWSETLMDGESTALAQME